MIQRAEVPAATPFTTTAVRRTRPALETWLLLAACLVVWPAVFASVVVATFAGVAIYADAPAGPLFWPLAWIVSAAVYSLAVGLPLVLCARLRRWYMRLIPAVIVAAPVGWIIGQAGVWSLPAVVTIAISIVVEATGLRQKLMVRVWERLTTLLRGFGA